MSSTDLIMGAAGASGAPATYIEDVFSTWLYTGNNTARSITNGVDLAGKGGLVWIKHRSGSVSAASPEDHVLYDTARGTGKYLRTNLTGGDATATSTLTSFNSGGFSLGTDSTDKVNYTNALYASWTFRKQPKFFDVVTYTGDGTTNRQVNHNLGSVPGMLIIKRTDSTSNWFVLSRANNGGYEGMYLNTTGASLGNSGNAAGAGLFSTYFDPEEYWGASLSNINGATYVAYLFAHNAGGFGAAGTDNVISCGSYTGNGSSSGPVINLGYEPQYVLIKSSSSGIAGSWCIFDNMRGIVTGGIDPVLNANLSDSEYTLNNYIDLNATGFSPSSSNAWVNQSGETYIYMAIRRPMKVPTDATTVFAPVLQSSSLATGDPLTTGFPIDSQWQYYRSGTTANNTSFVDRLRGVSTNSTAYGNRLVSSNTAAEVTGDAATLYFNNTGFQVPGWWQGISMAYYNFSRRPGFFDEVCTSVFDDGIPVTHNLGVTPELILVKTRSSASSWMGAVNDAGNIRNISINTTSGGYLPGLTYSSYFNSTTINPTGIRNGAGGAAKGTTLPVVIYLFATCPGVSKVGSYTGTGATQTINCGFTGGARFVLIKRTDSTGDWYVWDTARGMVSGTDPSFLLNSAAAQVNANSVYTATTGFQIVSTAAGINASGGSYIFLAIA